LNARYRSPEQSNPELGAIHHREYGFQICCETLLYTDFMNSFFSSSIHVEVSIPVQVAIHAEVALVFVLSEFD
jgi:hypothetical protein